MANLEYVRDPEHQSPYEQFGIGRKLVSVLDTEVVVPLLDASPTTLVLVLAILAVCVVGFALHVVLSVIKK